MAKTRKNYLPLYVRDFWTDLKVQAMTWDERTVYLHLLMMSWEEGPLPDPDKIADLMPPGAPGIDAIEAVYRRAWVKGKSGWTNPRLERERQHLESLWGSDVQRERAKRGWATKKRDAEGMPRASRGLADPSPGLAQTYQDQDQVQEQSVPSLRSGSGRGSRTAPVAATGKGSGKSPGLFDEALKIWEGLWVESRATEWAWDGKHKSAVRMALQKARWDLKEFEVRARRLLFDPPDYFLAQNSNPAMLNSRWNELGVTIVSVKTPQERKSDATSEWLKSLARNGNHPGGGRARGPDPSRPPLLEP